MANSVALGNNTSCASPGFATISDALAAAPSGAVVKVCAGTYDEQLAITQQTCTTGDSQATTGNDVVLCAKPGTSSAFLANNGTGNVLLIGNNGNDQLNGSSTGETWIIGGVKGTNVFNGNGGTGYIQERGDPHDTLVGTAGYTVAAS